MGALSNDLRKMGFELVCDETGIVIRGGEDMRDNIRSVAELSEPTPRYTHSKKVILPGGFSQAYEISQ